MSLIADGILILTCLTTAVYCYVLSRRLARLSNTDEGIGKQITQMNAGLEETRAAVKELRVTGKTASEALAREVAQARKVAAQLSRLNEAAAGMAANRYAATPAEAPVVEAEDPVETADPPEAVEDPVIPIAPPETDEDAAKQDASESSFFPEGKQQLGFLPEVDVSEEAEDEMALGSEPDHADDDMAEDIEGLMKGDASAQPNGVLTVERMAL